jgi:hypothetical protein
VGLVIIFFLITYVEAVSYSSPNTNKVREYILMLVVWFLVSTNPFMAAIMSEVILMEDQSLFYTTSAPFGNSTFVFLVSPWIIYILFYFVLTVILILISIARVRRPDR